MTPMSGFSMPSGGTTGIGSVQKASAATTGTPQKISGAMAFMMEMPGIAGPTRFVLETAQLHSGYYQCRQRICNQVAPDGR
jgi:homogentisate 1,2-dioxygenase